MTTVIDSHIFTNLFSTPEITAIWSDRQRTSYYLQFEVALAKAQAQLGIIPAKAAEEIVKHATLDNIDFDELRRQTELIGYPVLPMVQQIVRKVNEVEPGLGEWLHWGTTTQDLTDTAVVLQLRDTLQLVETSLNAIIKALTALSEKYKSTPMPARSNLQQAVPISFGFKTARLLATFLRHRQRLHQLRPRLLVLQFSGAAGTLATISPESSHAPVHADATTLAVQCQLLVAEHLDLALPEIAWHTERDSLAETATFLSLLTASCAKFATDLKLMMQSEVGEAREPYVPHRGSSSTMPQKRNPIGSAYICAMASSVRALAGGMVEAVVADHERSTGPWEIEWITLPQICALSHACLVQTQYLLEGLEVDEEGMKRNLALSRGAIVSEAVMMGLGKKIGRQYAHDVVYELCRRAQLEDKSLLELLKGDEGVKKAGLSDEELEGLCDPANYLGLSEVMVERVLAAAVAEEAS
ncbi:beta carboxy-cis-cis-muconate lactonizing enzyme, cyloisomerase, CLME2 [Neohortaea acidophila]|uniref:Beta carboxy-cis-cis-muconate lactonizing enzyme, cyloisomerase, CLME2 n=1 Tax=Neohortaea acidophila TaxID=245834 RepID=A0A6A6PR90_9PEZI|nr:beta carboxy-cis-cis-muconate lactonizing enzyme, cyloisomerase, CLME2 [Neohortaea acidophila]KAF2481727.1 beta carboxy-cis-cis-muconate lactonizing enzyme, cyloisomerase, CLME2 [Neohortaea acidophila]